MARRNTEKQMQSRRIRATGKRIVAAEGEVKAMKRGPDLTMARAEGFDVSLCSPVDGMMLLDIWADASEGKKVFAMRWNPDDESEYEIVSFRRGGWEAEFLDLAPLH